VVMADHSRTHGHSHPGDVIDLSAAHDHVHGHTAVAPTIGPVAGHRHANTAEAVTGDGPAEQHGRAHCAHEPEHHTGAGQEHDPGDDTTPTAGPLIDDVMRLLEPD
jgi:hypothetical protein